jgi:hypothetical protein
MEEDVCGWVGDEEDRKMKLRTGDLMSRLKEAGLGTKID